MIPADVYAVLVEGLRALFLIVLPLTVAVGIAGGLAGAVQTSTAISDVAIGYALRLLAAAVVLYMFFPLMTRSVVELAERAFR